MMIFATMIVAILRNDGMIMLLIFTYPLFRQFLSIRSDSWDLDSMGNKNR